MIEVKNITKSFKNSSKLITALSDISISFEKSKIYGIIGPNGAGKTTLIKIICGLIFPDSGNVFINNLPLYPSNFNLLRNIGAILEGSRNIFWNFTPLQNVKYFSLLKGIKVEYAISQAMKYFEIFDIVDKVNSPVRNLSQGMKQKIAIIISTLHNPSILLLDEPTLGLDPLSSQNMQALIKDLSYNERKTVILTSHHLDIIEKNCDYLLFLKEGKILFFDTVESIKKSFSQRIYRFTIRERGETFIIEKKLGKDDLNIFFDRIKSGNSEIIDIETKEQSLEDIFLENSSY